jgi:catechol-2,3-dioxygenase
MPVCDWPNGSTLATKTEPPPSEELTHPGRNMARIRHIALAVKDIDQTADFYEKALGLHRSPKTAGPTAWRVYMSDGELVFVG